MRLLLDTHVWVWALLEPARLSRRARTALRAPATELWVSPISTWELAILVDRGRVTLDCSLDDWLHRASEKAPIREAPLTHEIALATRLVETPHRDPADRFLAATARVLDLEFVTADARLLRGSGYATIRA